MMSTVLDIEQLSFEEALQALKKALAFRYPNCGMTYFAYSLSKDGINRTSTFGHFGNKRELELAGSDIAVADNVAKDFVDDVFLNRILSIKSSVGVRFDSLKRIHDAAIDYAHDLGIDTTGVGYWIHKKEDILEDKDKDKVRDVEAIASRIKMLQDEIKSLQRNLDPMAKVATFRAIAKRMRRAGDIVGANAKDKEAEEILAKLKRKEELKVLSIENLKKAREAKAKLKKQREQAEKDRMKAQQFNPHAAAKAKMRKIRERQQERNASKKKASESKEWTNRPIGQVIASRLC